MNLKASYFSPSLPLFKENLRRFWAISVLSFLVYFFTLAFPILMTYNNLSNLNQYISLSLHNYNPAFLMAHVFFPVIAAVLIFRYLHSVSPVTVIHAMPYTRQKLFVTNMLSGLFLLFTPILLNGLILLGLSKTLPKFTNSSSESQWPIIGGSNARTFSFDTTISNIFTGEHILTWIGISFVIVFFVYSISLLAGLITGNPLMHFTLACLFNFLIPVLLGVGIIYCSEFLWGYVLSDTSSNFILSFTPILKLIQAGLLGTGGPSFLEPFYIGIYVVSGILIMIATGFIYEKRKLERAGDSLVFHFMEPTICYIITFLGMTAFGFLFADLQGSSYGSRKIDLYVGFVAGSLLTFIIAQMMVKKTPRIFNLKSLRDLAIYGIIAVLFVSAINFDITGYEKRIPAVDNAKLVTISSPSRSDFDTIGYNPFNSMKFNSPENIASLQAFHKDVVDKVAHENVNFDNFSSSLLSVELSYDFGKGDENSRRYGVSQDFLTTNKNLKKIFESDEFKNSILYKNSPINEITAIRLSGSRNPSQAAAVTLKADEYTAFMECLDNDIKEMTYSEFMSTDSYYKINLSYMFKHPNTNNSLFQTEEISINKSFKNTVKWLEDHGYSDALAPSAKNIEKIDMHFEEITLSITNPSEILEILNTFETSPGNYNYIWGDIHLKDGYTVIEDKFSESKATNLTQIYYSEGSGPDFLLKRFEEAKK